MEDLPERRAHCKRLCHALNQLPPDQKEARTALLRQILGKTGERFHIEPTFWCDYGTNITVGEDFYANHNLVILDCAPVTFGDHVFIAPNCGFYAAGHPLDAPPAMPPWSTPSPSPWVMMCGSAATWWCCPA